MEEGLRVYQNYPNPIVESTTISYYIPEKGLVSCLVADIMGRVVCQYEKVLESGVHSFSYTPGGGKMSLFTVQWQNFRETIKMLHPNLNQRGSASLSYIGLSSAPKYENKASEAMQGFSFALEDVLLYIGYFGGVESGILDAPLVSDTFYFQFATNIPCPGTPTVTYEGQVYNTIQIFSQCWLKENLNVGTMIDSLEDAEDNGIIEKYCYRNSIDSCDKYGGLYQWDEMMQYEVQQSIQGICPQGWHIPSDEEWSILEGAADSEFGIGDTVWDLHWIPRGYDVGANLKSAIGWANDGNGADLYGFTALPGGRRYENYYGEFRDVYAYGSWWTSTKISGLMQWDRLMSCYGNYTHRNWLNYDEGYSVRCVKN